MRKLLNEELGRPSADMIAGLPKIPVVVVLDNVRSMNNVGAFFRTGDAFGVGRMVLCGITGTPPDREIHKTALGAENTVAWEYSRDTEEAVRKLREEGFRVVAVEQIEGSTQLDEFVPEDGARYALVFGNEVDGVRQSVVDMCDAAIEIPQVGAKHSLNVSVSGGVVLWSFFCAFRKEL
jgi:tRNA G18 (ribose-2'-O)-methylase SpoU